MMMSDNDVDYEGDNDEEDGDFIGSQQNGPRTVGPQGLVVQGTICLELIVLWLWWKWYGW